MRSNAKSNSVNFLHTIPLSDYHSVILVVSIVVVSVINLNWVLLYQTTYYRIVVKGSKSELQKKYSLYCLFGCKYFSTFSYKMFSFLTLIYSFILIPFYRIARPTRFSRLIWTHWSRYTKL